MKAISDRYGIPEATVGGDRRRLRCGSDVRRRSGRAGARDRSRHPGRRSRGAAAEACRRRNGAAPAGQGALPVPATEAARRPRNYGRCSAATSTRRLPPRWRGSPDACANLAPSQPGDRIAIVAPASSASTEELHAGGRRAPHSWIRAPSEMTLFRADGLYRRYRRKCARPRCVSAWLDPSIAAIVAARGGYGSVQLLPLLKPAEFADASKAFIGYSDNTSLLAWLTLTCGIVTFHGPMIEGRLARGPAGYDRDTFDRCLARPAAIGRITHPQFEVIRPGEATGMLIGGTMTQLAGVARDALRVRSATRMRAVLRRSCGASVSSGPPVHPTCAGRHHQSRLGSRLRRDAALR